MQTATTSNTLLSRSEAAAALGVSLSTLESWAHRGRPALRYVRVGKLAKYRLADIEQFIASNSGTSSTAITAAQAQVALAAQSA